MYTKDLARKIPNNVRSQRLICDADPIGRALPIQTDYNMNLLFNIWFTFIEPNGVKKLNCPNCLQTVLSNFQYMKGYLIELEKEYQLLNSL